MLRNKKLIFGGCLVIVGFSLLVVTWLSDSYSLFSTSEEATGEITVPENNYCINHGFDTLSECMLVMENYSSSVSAAKTYIESKGSGTFSQMAPTITYKELTSDVTNSSGVISTTSHFTLGKSYTFNSTTGMFTLTNYTNTDLTDDYVGYYTCGGTTGTWNSCATMYQIKDYTKTTASNGTTTYRVTSAVKHTYNAVDALDSEIGLYAAEDDYGTSYYYRGNVKNNYVSFAGFTWRIIRENGDGSVRMIYSGTSPSATGSATSIGTSAFNSKNYDPTYLGYMYSEDFALNTSQNSSTSYYNFNENVKYYFGSSYTFDSATKTFKLTGDMISGTWKEVHDEAVASYPYTCFGTSASSTCTVMKKTTKYTNAYTAVVTLISNNSKNYAATLNNTTDSTIKGKIDTWYQTNILNKSDEKGQSYASYLADSIFCGDRSLNTGSGYLLSPTSTYGAYNRVYQNRKPSLSCKQEADSYTVSSDTGNGKLTYPVGLLTIDEASMAGGLYNSVNTQYYLYTGQTYWTMSPSYFYSTFALAHAWSVNSTGSLYNGYAVSNSYGVRPVVNLSADVLISGGDGSASNPYVVVR